jgi:hypothetical protein
MSKRFVCAPFTFAMILVAAPLLTISGQSGEAINNFTGEVMDSICAPSGSHATTMAKTPGMGSDSETCTKKCVSMGAKYVLYDPASRAMYSVDDQDKIAQFAGQRVRVRGTLKGSAIKVASVDKLS